MTTATWIAIALLTPLWWGVGLLILAWLGDVSPPLRPRVSRLFNWLEHTRMELPNAVGAARSLPGANHDSTDSSEHTSGSTIRKAPGLTPNAIRSHR
jgi:hypothetical protein